MTREDLLNLFVSPSISALEPPIKAADPDAVLAFMVAASDVRGGLGQRFENGNDSHGGNSPRGPWRLKLDPVRTLVTGKNAEWLHGAAKKLGYEHLDDKKTKPSEWHRLQGYDPILATAIVLQMLANDRAQFPALDEPDDARELFKEIFGDPIDEAAWRKAWGAAVAVVAPPAPSAVP